MAVINVYVDSNLAAGKLAAAVNEMGSKVVRGIAVFSVGATDAAGSVYRLFKGLSPDMIVQSLSILNDALTGASSVKFGFYGVQDYDNVGAIVGSGNQLGSAIDISSGNPISSGLVTVMKAVAIADRSKRIYELCGHTQLTKLPAYDLCMTMTAMTTGANGNVAVFGEFIQG